MFCENCVVFCLVKEFDFEIMEKRSSGEEEEGVGKKDRIFRADKIDLKSLDKQLEKHLSRVWSRNIERNHKPKEEEWEIDLAKLETRNVIARGTYGTVYRGIYDGQDVAGNFKTNKDINLDLVYFMFPLEIVTVFCGCLNNGSEGS